jgi:DNA-binding transcriptional ArsR family regulator
MLQSTMDQTFSALADPTRRAILAQLARGESNVSDLAEPFLQKMSLPAITKHIKVLENAGLIIKTHDKQFRPCRLNASAMKEAADWIDTYRVFWEESFDRLDAYLKTVTPSSHKGKSDDKTP